MASWTWLASEGGNRVYILLGDGTGKFHLASSPATGASPLSVAVGDFNGDGWPDLAVANGGSNTVSILLNKADGTGNFTLASSPATRAEPDSVAVGDFNGDGWPDLAVANSGSNTVSILLNKANGTGNFTLASSPATGTSPLSVAVGDFNGDGRLDLAVANSGSNTISILLGQQTFPVTITPTSLPSGQVGGWYGGSSVACSGGCGVTLTAAGGSGMGYTYTWSPVAGSSLPPGLNLSNSGNNGLISGTPAKAGTFVFTVQVTDSLSDLGTQRLTVTVNPSVFAVNPGGPDTKVLLPVPQVIGQVVFVPWSCVETASRTFSWTNNGSDGNPDGYTCQSIETQINSWYSSTTSGGNCPTGETCGPYYKKTGLVIWLNADDTSINATPSWEWATSGQIGSPTYGVKCTGGANVPNFLLQTFQSDATNFIETVLKLYDTDPRIAYIRVGLGGGGETDARCRSAQETSYGLSKTNWGAYLQSMIQGIGTYLQANTPAVPVQVALNCYDSAIGTKVPDPCSGVYTIPNNVASQANSYGIGIGHESLQANDITDYNDSPNICDANWCGNPPNNPSGNFLLYSNLFHDLQFDAMAGYDQNAQNESGEGDPTTLLPFATTQGADVVEMLPESKTNSDTFLVLLMAYDPTQITSPYTCEYQEAIQTFEGQTASCNQTEVHLGPLARAWEIFIHFLSRIFHFLFGWIHG
jgi:hypothetical protein